MKTHELIGARFGRWEVLSLAGKNSSRERLVNCRCSCGTERVVRPSSLKDGSSSSCGCLRVDRCIESVRKHGLSRSPTYSSWRAMLGRCYDPRNASFAAYSAKGISVCNRWRDSFENFVEDMGMRPSKKYSIDRINNAGPYTKENCRWATGIEQQANRRISKTLTIDGVMKPLSEWARISGIQYQTLKARLKHGWAPYEAVYTPLGIHTKRKSVEALYPGVKITEVK